MPCATFFTLDPYPGGAHGQGLPPEPELGPLPRDCPGPLCSDPSAGKSGHPVSARPSPGPGPHSKQQTWLQSWACTWGMCQHTPAWLSLPSKGKAV